jgi:hypothetical protein
LCLSTLNRFRNDQNIRYTKGLFFETTLADKSSVVYTLKDWDHEGYPSLYRLYMETNDPTEWQFATKYLDGWEHWEILCECNWFKPYIARWRRELEIRMKSQSLARIMASAKIPGKEQLMANRYLIEKGWEPKGEQDRKRGRPSKEDIQKEAHRISSTDSRLNADFERINSLKAVN